VNAGSVCLLAHTPEALFRFVPRGYYNTNSIHPKPFPTNRRDFSGWKKHLFLAACEILRVFLQKAFSQLQDIFIQKFRKGNIDRKTPYFSFSFGAVIP
jgi:hypothetical protein